MALEKVTKQSYESFPVSVSFADDMADGEVITTQTITCADVDGTDVTATILSSPINDGAQSAQVIVSDGEQASSPYKLTFKVVTDTGNKWEYDIKLAIKEL